MKIISSKNKSILKKGLVLISDFQPQGYLLKIGGRYQRFIKL